jgi:cell division protein FtsL
VKLSGNAATHSIVMALIVATGVALIHVWIRLEVIALGYELSHETKVRHDLTEMNQRLSLELRTRTDLARVEKVARDTLHMVPADPRMLRIVPLVERAPQKEGSR